MVASLVGAATLFCLAMICLAVPQQMNEEMRAYGANLIVTPTESTNADGKAGIDKQPKLEGRSMMMFMSPVPNK